MRLIAISLVILATSVAQAVPPAGTVNTVNEHRKGLNNPKEYRYVSMHNIIATQRKGASSVVSYLLNSVSRRRIITVPKVIDHVIVVELDDYDIPAKAWDAFASKEPYSNITDGNLATNKPGDPRWIIRADWFIVNASITPGYYNLLRVRKQKDFADLVKLVRNEMEQSAVVTTGNVARNHRYIRRIPTIYGGAWVSYDNKAEILKNLLEPEFGQAEYMAPLANGLNAYFISDKTGKQLNHGDPKLTVDPNFTTAVWAGRSCMVCHDSGVKDFTDSVRKLIKKNIEIKATDKESLRKITEQFGRDLPFKQDQELYKNAVKEATGYTAPEISRLLKNFIDGYNGPVNKTMAIQELGWNAMRFNKIARTNTDPNILTLYKDGDIRRNAWEEVFATLCDGQ